MVDNRYADGARQLLLRDIRLGAAVSDAPPGARLSRHGGQLQRQRPTFARLSRPVPTCLRPRLAILLTAAPSKPVFRNKKTVSNWPPAHFQFVGTQLFGCLVQKMTLVGCNKHPWILAIKSELWLRNIFDGHNSHYAISRPITQSHGVWVMRSGRHEFRFDFRSIRWRNMMF